MAQKKPNKGPTGPRNRAAGVGTKQQTKHTGKGSGNSHKSQLTGK